MPTRWGQKVDLKEHSETTSFSTGTCKRECTCESNLTLGDQWGGVRTGEKVVLPRIPLAMLI